MDRRARLQSAIGEINSKFPQVSSLTPRQVLTLQQEQPTTHKKVVFVDCRTREERQVSKIDPEALSEEEFLSQLESLKEKDIVVVSYCTIGYRSAEFVTKYQGSIDGKMYNLSGSLLSWIDEGYPVYRGVESSEYPEPVKEIHVWGKQFSQYAPEEYSCTYFKVPLWSTMTSWVSKKLSR